MYVHAERSFSLRSEGLEKSVINHFAQNVDTDVRNIHRIQHTPHVMKGIRTHTHNWYVGTLELASRIKYVDATRTSVACVDSRLDIAVASSPGGDVAELVHALSAFEHVHQVQLTTEDIGELFHVLIARRTQSNPFFVCTDQNSMSKVSRAANVVDVFEPQNEEEMERILTELTNPSNHGDVHISAMLQRPSLWRVRKDLLHEVIRIAYRAIISQDKRVHIILAVLSGSHSIQDGLVRVQNVIPECSGQVPLLIPRGVDPTGPYAVMGYGDMWRPLRAWYAKRIVQIFRKGRLYFPFHFNAFSDLIQQYGASREEQAVVMSSRTHVLRLYDFVLDK